MAAVDASLSHSTEKAAYLVLQHDKGTPPSVQEIRQQLENGPVSVKIDTLKRVILLLLNGEPLQPVLMPVIRFVVPVDDHVLKKLLLVYFEVCDKYGSDGKLLPEMILVCNALRNDLNHANEYIRGITLRFLCKLREPELLEPLVPSVKLNLEHRHSYVRRNAVLAVYTIYSFFENLIPDAPDLIEKFLNTESDLSARRNAFLMLYHCSQDRAIGFLSSVIDQVPTFGDILQLAVLELIRKICRTNPMEKSKYLRCIFNLLNSPSSAVVFECANSLVALSASPTAIKAAVGCYTQLLCNQSDNNVKLIVLEKLVELKSTHTKVVQDMLMDILRTLQSPNLDIRKRTLDIALDLVSPRNIDDVVQVLKKEIVKTQEDEQEKGGEYRQVLIQVINQCALRFPEVANSVVHLLMDFLGDPNPSIAAEVAIFVREIIQSHPSFHEAIMRRLLDCFFQIKASRVFRVAMWIIGENSATAEDIEFAFSTIKQSIGDLPLLAGDAPPSKDEAAATNAVTDMRPAARPAVLADGTYATQSAEAPTLLTTASNSITNTVSIRSLLISGDFFLGAVLATTLTKLALKSREQQNMDSRTLNQFTTEVLSILCEIFRLGKSNVPPQPMDGDSADRISLCIHALIDPSLATQDLWINACKTTYQRVLEEKRQAQKAEADERNGELRRATQVDDLINFQLLRGKRQHGQPDYEDSENLDIKKATGNEEKEEDFGTRLSRITQLTGFSDPIYAEAFVTVHQFDIVLEVLVVNRTAETLQNVCLELSTVGDLKLCERPQNYTLAPSEGKTIKASIKVSSTETGIIFGNIVYDTTGPSSRDLGDKNCVVLNDIHIDIMDYITPATCTDMQFRQMWTEFEWENKVAVNTTFVDVNAFLCHIIKSTNMKCLTPPSALLGDCPFLAANLYAKSIFGEDALVNVSVEKQADGKIGGFVRIRSKTQGIALSLGDKITLKQRA
eukprot:TRINITY_DN35578_c0_g1_i1.p1 TRINITY_DN35578_c0_g1~~TRINITY_DN35578_c0_g1_i1.p1  ORF type:complete len:969 (-),score=237.04 TRINITY_DN35578_c0_g1_i1:11-2890(-)